MPKIAEKIQKTQDAPRKKKKSGRNKVMKKPKQSKTFEAKLKAISGDELKANLLETWNMIRNKPLCARFRIQDSWINEMCEVVGFGYAKTKYYQDTTRYVDSDDIDSDDSDSDACIITKVVMD